MREQEYEKILGVKTTGRDDSRSNTFNYPYEPTPYCVLDRIAKSGYVEKKTVLLDYGCGKGRVDFFLAWQLKCHCIGIDYDPRMWGRAMENRESFVRSSFVEFLCEDAASFLPSETIDRFYFFNPFSVEILRKVLSRILDSYYANPRECLLLFYYPSEEYISCLMTMDELSFVDEIDCRDLFPGNNNREVVLIFEIQ